MPSRRNEEDRCSEEEVLTAEAAPVFPGPEWARAAAADVGMDAAKLEEARRWLESRVGEERYRVVIVRGGRVVAEWNHGVGRDERLGMASAAKSIFSCMLGIAIAEGKIPSADAKVVDYYPEMMDVPEGEGPKKGRFAREKDRDITFRQLICNTSGYLKPGEQPGKVFHYQTFGMNILTHAIAESYGLYDISDPEGSAGLRKLMDERLRVPLGATWQYSLSNFDLHPRARTSIFGYYQGVLASAVDMARLGWLWLNWGLWRDEQLVPETWLREATRTAPDVVASCPREQWQYGHGFWTNEYGLIWPSLPRDSFAASGAGSQHIWVCPSLDLVVVQSPGLWQKQHENDTGLLRLVADAVI